MVHFGQACRRQSFYWGLKTERRHRTESVFNLHPSSASHHLPRSLPSIPSSSSPSYGTEQGVGMLREKIATKLYEGHQ